MFNIIWLTTFSATFRFQAPEDVQISKAGEPGLYKPKLKHSFWKSFSASQPCRVDASVRVQWLFGRRGSAHHRVHLGSSWPRQRILRPGDQPSSQRAPGMASAQHYRSHHARAQRPRSGRPDLQTGEI